MRQKEIALNYLKGLKLDIEESDNGKIDIEYTDLEEINNCIKVIEKHLSEEI